MDGQLQITRYHLVALGVVSATQMSNAIFQLSLPPLAPLFQPELGLTKAQVGLFSSATYAGSTVLVLAAGALTDRWGVRRMMVLGQAVIGALMLSMAAVGAFWQAVLAMFLGGGGTAAIQPATTKAIAEWFPARARATAMGLKQACVPLGGVLTAAILPSIGIALGWRAAIAASGLLIICLAALSGIFYRNAPRLDRVANPGLGTLRNFKLVVRNRPLWAVTMVSVLYAVAQTSAWTYLALYLSDTVLVVQVPDEGARVVAAGGYLAICQMGGAFGRVALGLVSDRAMHGRRFMMLAATGLGSALVLLLLAFVGTDFPLWLLACVALTYGIVGVGWSGLYHTLMSETVPRDQAGTAVGMSMTLNQMAIVFGPPTFGAVVDIAGSYTVAWLMLGAMSLAGCAVAAMGARTEKVA